MSLFSLIKRPKSDATDGVSPSMTPPAVVLRELPAEPPAVPTVDDSPTAEAAATTGEPDSPTSTELRSMLFDAIARGDESRVMQLCREHRQFVHDYAPAWLIVPESLRANPAAAKWYGRGLRQLLQQLCSTSK